MPRPAPSRVAAALNYLERLKNQAAEFGGGVVENLADRARSAGELAYEALATDPNMGRMTTAEYAQAADRPTPRLDEAARQVGALGRAIATQPVETGKAIVQGEVERAREAMSSPRAAGQYAGSFIDPMRMARMGMADRASQRIAQALEAAPTAYEQRLRELFGDFAQAYNFGVPDTPEFRRIVQEVTAQGPLSDDALREAIKAHPAYRQAGGKAAAAELRQSKRNGAAALVDSLSEQGIKTRVETSKSPGSRSTYIYASKGGKTVKIRLSDHLPAESGRVYGTNDIMTTPQHWKSAAKRALELLEEAD